MELDPKVFGVKHDNSKHFVIIFILKKKLSPLRRNKRFLMNLGKKKNDFFYYLVQIQRINLLMHNASQCKKNYIYFFYPNSLRTFYFGGGLSALAYISAKNVIFFGQYKFNMNY